MVAEDQVIGMPADRHRSLAAVQGRFNVVAVERERLRDGLAELCFVVDHQDTRSTHWRLRGLYGARRMPPRHPSV